MTLYNFTVDAELLRELGERLVGRPHIALAELIKNSYDADATSVKIEFTKDRIIVSDNGHGMSEADFVNRWMRVGTTHKRTQRKSPSLGRTLTGSKGVGRLAAQLLAQDIEITSVGLTDPTNPESSGAAPAMDARVDWRVAMQAGDLTDVQVLVTAPSSLPRFANGSTHGTRITLKSLTEQWDAARFRELAEEIWALKPPFETADEKTFDIHLESPFPEVIEAFNLQMRAIFDVWTAKVTGRLLPINAEPSASLGLTLPNRLPAESTDDEVIDPDVIESGESALDDEESEGWLEDGAGPAAQSLAARDAAMRDKLPTRYLEATVEMRDGTSRTAVWRVDHCEIDQMDFEVLVFELRHRQPKGLKVSEAREYLRRFGGVAIYDNGFKLPYYGADQDWLAIERDFAARRVGSELIPKGLSVNRGLLELPRNQALFGRVTISTNHEEQIRADLGLEEKRGLSIQVTRDRLSHNDAYEQLRVMTRAPVDLYAMEKARQKLVAVLPPPGAAYAPRPKVSDTFAEVKSVLEESRTAIPPKVFVSIERAVESAVERALKSEDTAQAYASVLGALATAGMTSLAYEHEMSKQVKTISSLARRLSLLAPDMTDSTRPAVEKAVKEMKDWAKRAARLRDVFKPLVARETREHRDRMSARKTVIAVAKQIESLASGIEVDASGIPQELLLPKATYPAWSSIFQNLLINAYNALWDSDNPRLVVVGGGTSASGWLEFRDTGAGVDLATAHELWEPFERRLVLPQEREEAGLGGMGLGLTIIRMVSDEIGVRVRFVAPPKEFSTSVRIEWRNQQ